MPLTLVVSDEGGASVVDLEGVALGPGLTLEDVGLEPLWVPEGVPPSLT